MKKILFYTTFLTQGGGVEVVTERYLKKFINEGYRVDLYIDYDMGFDNIREKNIDKKIKIKYLKSEKISKLIYKFRTLGKKNSIYNIPMYILVIFSDFFVWRKEKKIIENEKYDATITFFQFLPGYITKIKGPKHLIFLHGSVKKFFFGVRKYFKNLFFRKLNKFNYICTVSQEMGEELIEIFPLLREKQRTVYNPIDEEEIRKKAEDFSEIIESEKKLIKERYICSVGRLDESQKDFTTLIEAFDILKKDGYDRKLFIIGEGPDRKKLEFLVREKKLEKDILFLGRKKNPYIWIKNAETFVLSSKYEGFPTVLIESLVLKTSTISSNCPTGPKEILLKDSLFEIENFRELALKIKEKKGTKIFENKEKFKNKLKEIIG